jgi:hypothetical protein
MACARVTSSIDEKDENRHEPFVHFAAGLHDPDVRYRLMNAVSSSRLPLIEAPCSEIRRVAAHTSPGPQGTLKPVSIVIARSVRVRSEGPARDPRVALPGRRCYATPVSRILVMLATMVLIAHGAPGVTLAAEEGTSTLTGGGTTSGPPAPAAPGVAATPEAAPKPAVPNAPLEPGVAAREEPVEAPAPAAKPRSVNLWPLFQYESDPATRKTHVSIFGPLIEYRADANRQAFFVRPLVSIDQSRVGHDDHTSFLGPLLTSDWGQTEQVTKGLGGLFTYRTRTSADGRTLEAQRARLLPIYFYDWDQTEPKGRVSVVPLYADIDDFLGYERIEMMAFPAYLRLKRPSLDRYYYPYPIIRRDGPPGSGYRLWPFPLRDRQGRRVEREAAATEPERQTYFPVMRDELDATAPESAHPS